MLGGESPGKQDFTKTVPYFSVVAHWQSWYKVESNKNLKKIYIYISNNYTQLYSGRFESWKLTKF